MINEHQIEEIVKKMFKDISFEEEPKGLYDPLRYMIEIGGKRIRPSLCLTTYSLFKDEINEGILSPASALEVFHSFTLMHDDIMDRSPLRRGESTVWKKWNENTAILSGDVMLIDAFKRIAKAPVDIHNQVHRLFSKTTIQVCEGQQYDMEFEDRDDVSMDEYEKMIGLKTAVLIACSACMGAILGGASEKDCQAIYDYGYELGMAFQVADDYLDAFGDEKVFGKPIGGDILNCKKTWLTVKTLEKIEEKEIFNSVFETEPKTQAEKQKKIEAIKQLYIDYGVDLDARSEIEYLTSCAIKALNDSSLTKVQIKSLERFANKLVGRVK